MYENKMVLVYAPPWPVSGEGLPEEHSINSNSDFITKTTNFSTVLWKAAYNVYHTNPVSTNISVSYASNITRGKKICNHGLSTMLDSEQYNLRSIENDSNYYYAYRYHILFLSLITLKNNFL
jgi:hypothetical protein